MNKVLSLAFLIAGIVLLVMGLNSSDSVASHISNAATGSPTNHSIWLIILGILGIVVGGGGLLFGRRSS